MGENGGQERPIAEGGTGSTRTLPQRRHDALDEAWGWTITCDPDGTTATKPDGRTLHSHSPPGQPA